MDIGRWVSNCDWNKIYHEKSAEVLVQRKNQEGLDIEEREDWIIHRTWIKDSQLHTKPIWRKEGTNTLEVLRESLGLFVKTSKRKSLLKHSVMKI